MTEQAESTVVPRRAQPRAVAEYIHRRAFVKKALAMGIGLPFFTQIILEGCGTQEEKSDIIEGSAHGGALDGATFTLATLPNNTNSALSGRITLGNITTEIAFTADNQIEQALVLIDQTADTNRYRITLMDPDDQLTLRDWNEKSVESPV